MKIYIDFNTEKIMNAAIDFEKWFFKLMINSVYGKTMENLRERIQLQSLKLQISRLLRARSSLTFRQL